jgi:head-tail adaptor
MSTAIRADELTWMRSERLRLMPEPVQVQRATLAADGYGGQSETWTTTATVLGLIYPVNSRTFGESATGGQVTSTTRWFASLPTTTDVIASDRIVYDGRSWEVLSVNNDVTWQTAVRCELSAYNEELRS